MTVKYALRFNRFAQKNIRRAFTCPLKTQVSNPSGVHSLASEVGHAEVTVLNLTCDRIQPGREGLSLLKTIEAAQAR